MQDASKYPSTIARSIGEVVISSSNQISSSGIGDRNLKMVQQSFGRCCLTENFFDTFYRVFFDSSPEIGPYFATTDMARQKDALRNSLAFVLMFGRGQNYALELVSDLAVKHSRQKLDIKPHLYRLWLKSLIESIRRHDSDFCNELEKAWRVVVGKAIERMTSEY